MNDDARSGQSRTSPCSEIAVLEAMLEHSDSPLVFLDREFNFVRVNKAYADTCRRAPDQFAGHNHFELYPNAENEAIFKHARETGEPAVWSEKPFEFPDQPDRGVTYWDWTLTPLRQQGGGVTAFVFSLRDVTDQVIARKRIEELALGADRQAAEATAILDSLNDVVLIYDTEMNVRRANPSFHANFGFDPTGLNLREIIARVNCRNLHGKGLVWSEQPTPSALRGRPVVGAQFFVTRSNGDEMVVETSSRPLLDGEHIIGSVTSWHDITHRARAQRELTKAQDLLEAATQGASVTIAVQDTSLRYLFFNHAYRQEIRLLTGRDLQVGMSMAEVLSDMPDQQRVAVEAWSRALQGESSTTRIEFGDPARYRRVYSVRHTPIWDSDRRIIGAGEVAQDVTEQVRTEQALEQSEARFRGLAEAMPQLVWIADSEGQSVYLNRRWIEFAGQSLATAEERGKLIHPQDMPRVLERWNAAIRSGSVFDCEYRMRRHDGEYRWFLTRSVQTAGVAGAKSWIGTATDIHELKLAQEALRDADRRKNEFLAMLAHELRNPLAAISNAHHVLESCHNEDARVQRVHGLLGRQVKHLARLVDDLLDVARITQGKIVLQPERLQLASCIEAAVAACSPMMEAAGHGFHLSLPSEPVWVQADPARVEQIVGNMLSNAIKYTEPGGRIDLALQVHDANAIVRVRDNGIGIEPALMPSLFQPFTQADTSPARSKGGLGVGLALVRSLVELHGGSVRAHSDGLGKGAEFVASFPITHSDRPAQRPAVQAREQRTRRKILVVDDNRDAADSLADLIGLWGHDARCVYEGASAMQLATTWLPDVVLLDLGMPDMDGYEVARQLRARPELADARIVAVTGYGHEEAREQVRVAGFDGHLIKPVAAEELERLIAAKMQARAEA